MVTLIGTPCQSFSTSAPPKWRCSESHYHADTPLVPRNGHTLIVGIVARISGSPTQKELSLDDQQDHAKEVAVELYTGPVEYRVVATIGKGESLDRPELAKIEAILRPGELDLLIAEDIGRMVRGLEAVRLIGIGVDHGIRTIAPNAAEPQPKKISKDGIHPTEWLVLTSTSLGRMPCLQYVASQPSLPASSCARCTASTGSSSRAIRAWPCHAISNTSSIASSRCGAAISSRTWRPSIPTGWSTMPSAGRGKRAVSTWIAAASSARTSGLTSSSATSESALAWSASSAPRKPVSYQLVPGPERPQFIRAPRQQRGLYYYFLDPNFGLIHVRLQTWLPFTVQVYVNGHEYLAQQMVRKQLGFVQQHNAFTQLDDPAAAQRLADRFAKLDWPKLLDHWARQVNPLLRELLPDQRIRWVVDQAEYASDLWFTSRQALAGLYRKLLDYAVLTFTPKSILGFLGRKWDRRFDGEVHTQHETDRWFGTRIKHRLRRNWLKLYDKFGLILRVETVINAPQEFSVYRTRSHRDGTATTGYFPMTKTVHSLVDYQAQALACNRRYLEALAVVDDPAPAYQDLRQLTEPQVVKERSYAAFNPARRDDVRLFLAVLQGDGIARGFRNADVRSALFAATKDKEQQRRASAAVGRLLKRLYVRHLLAKIPRTHRWRVTERGRHLLGLAVQLYRKSWPQLAA